MMRLAPASQDLYSGENSFLDLPCHLNKPARAKQHPSVPEKIKKAVFTVVEAL